MKFLQDKQVCLLLLLLVFIVTIGGLAADKPADCEAKFAINCDALCPEDDFRKPRQCLSNGTDPPACVCDKTVGGETTVQDDQREYSAVATCTKEDCASCEGADDPENPIKLEQYKCQLNLTTVPQSDDEMPTLITKEVCGCGSPGPKDCTDPVYTASCVKVCADPSNIPFPQCIQKVDRIDTCLCQNKIGGMLKQSVLDKDIARVESNSDCKEMDDDQCAVCPKNYKSFYCRVTTTKFDKDGKELPREGDRRNVCGCAMKPDDMKNESRRRRGKFPPILDQIMKALKTARAKFSRRRN